MSSIATLLSAFVGYLVFARCRTFGHRFKPYTTIHLGDRYVQTFICDKCKVVRKESRRRKGHVQ